MTEHIAKILAGMNENELRELLGAVNAERNQDTPTMADGAALYRREQSGGMNIPRGVSPERLAELLRQANPGDTFRIDGDQSSHINVSRNG